MSDALFQRTRSVDLRDVFVSNLQLGTGHTARAYLGVIGDRFVAVKQSCDTKLRCEADALRVLDEVSQLRPYMSAHRYWEYAVDAGVIRVLMSELSMCDLHDYTTHMSSGSAARVSEQLVDALCTLHGHGWVLQNVSTRKLMIYAGERLKIHDFSSMLRTGSVVSKYVPADTEHLLHPIFHDDAVSTYVVDTYIDHWSMCAVLFYCVFGIFPYSIAHPRDVTYGAAAPVKHKSTINRIAMARDMIQALEEAMLQRETAELLYFLDVMYNTMVESLPNRSHTANDGLLG